LRIISDDQFVAGQRPILSRLRNLGDFGSEPHKKCLVALAFSLKNLVSRQLIDGRAGVFYSIFSNLRELKIVELSRAGGSPTEFNPDEVHAGKLRQFYNAFTRSVQNLTAATAFFRRQDFDESTDISSL
jgi:hypothetical protein